MLRRTLGGAIVMLVMSAVVATAESTDRSKEAPAMETVVADAAAGPSPAAAVRTGAREPRREKTGAVQRARPEHYPTPYGDALEPDRDQ